MAEVIQNSVIKAITNEIDGAFSNEEAVDIGMLTIKSANRTIDDASRRPDPEQLFHELWYEGEVCCLFADSNLGKSIFAVQMADEISRTRIATEPAPIKTVNLPSIHLRKGNSKKE